MMVVKGIEFFCDKVLSRNCPMDCSSRVFYNMGTEGVPFKWEMQPGTPKHPPKEDTMQPLIPPPALLSLGLPKPRINNEEPKASMKTRLMFWKHSKKRHKMKKAQAGSKRSNGFELWW
ncbi:hypothetical protein CFOL_v3_33078 [Cephalotus follicularis]|uniref:Uncharacterized protein n=1 Tax=Cephalotus follicularis TaxID=3775 RepID=A0A1Q3DB05_CEPFO|nr:hypothetical protein CFOL_v3_33078 [Cephalotus follicularis]